MGVRRESEGEFEVHGVPVTFRGCDESLYATTVDILWAQLVRDADELRERLKIQKKNEEVLTRRGCAHGSSHRTVSGRDIV
jgi:hypothetical protein